MSLRKLKRQAMRQQTKTNQALRDQYQASVKALNTAQTINGIIQNGVTPKMLEDAENKAFQRGYGKGLEVGATPYVKVYCAAVCLALHRHFGFGGVRCSRVLNEALEIVNHGTWIEPEEVIDQAEQETGIDLGVIRMSL